MFIRRSQDCKEFIANDGCSLIELLHPHRLSVDLPYSLAVAKLAPGQRTHPHVLAQTEVYFLLQGRGRMHVGAETAELAAGDAVLIPAGQTQWIENIGTETLRFIALVSPPWRAEDDRRIDA
jgi:mannose-6-phosphate isomerase-like protein (cupin superfamily)